MTFLAPLYLLLGGAALVPLLIHLLRRRIGLRVEFPAARYLARAEQEHSRTLRLRNLLLMLLRMLIVLLVAVAAARPIGQWVGAGHAPTALALVLDNSLSTSVIENGRPLLASLRGAAKDALRQAGPADRVWLVTADGRVRGGTPATLVEEVDRVEALGGAGNLQLALARAAELVRSSGLEARQVAVVTDGQRTAWEHPTVAGDAQVLVLTQGGTPPPNRAVVLAEARPSRWTPRGTLVARILSRDSAAYRMTLGGRVLARGTAAPNEEVTIAAAPPERGWVAGTVELEPDELPGDNVRHFALWIGAAPSVTVASSAGPFARSAVDVLRASERVVPGSDISVVAADELSSLPALILAPADPVKIGVANRALERAGIPWRFGALRRGAVTVREGAIRSGALATRLNDITATIRYELVPQAGVVADTLALVGREPWIVSGPRYVLVASPMLPEATTLPIRAAFVPWLAEVIGQRLVGEPGQIIAATPAARVARPRWAESLDAPGGARTPLTDSVDVPSQPGTFFFIRGDRRVGALVVNPEPEESVLDRWPAAEIARRIQARRVLTAADRSAWIAQAFRAASRRSLIEPVLLAALLLLAIEAFVVGTTLRRIA